MSSRSGGLQIDEFQERLQSYPEGGEKKGKKSSGIQGRPQQEGGPSQPRIFESVFKKKQRKGAELCAALLRAPGSLRSSIVRGSAD